jgi:hypothetical protein
MENPKSRHPVRSSFESGFRPSALQYLALLVAVSGAAAFQSFGKLALLQEEVSESLSRSEQRFRNLRSQVQFDSERSRLLLGIAEARSGAGERGLYQIYPSTGRLLARMLGWEFDEALLHDPVKNTEMAACYLDLLGAAYNDVEMILAEYNGGPLNAGYFRANVRKLADETRDFVPRVIAVYERLGREIRETVPLSSARATGIVAYPEARTFASTAPSAERRQIANE